MMMSRFCWIIIFFFFITLTTFFSGLPSVTSRQYSDDVYPTANLSTLWVNNRSDLTFADNSRVSLVLLRAKENTSDFVAPRYASGFYCYGTSDSCLFTIFAVDVNSYGGIIPSGSAQVVWSANRNNSVRDNATLELTAEGDLVLRDADGTLAWSTNTAGRSVAGLNLTDMGNLVLFNANKSVVWQSFDHPTDCLLPGQILRSGKNLTASASDTNWTEGGSYSLSMTDRGLVASILSDPPQVYYSRRFPAGTKQNKEGSYARSQNGSLDLYITRVEPLDPDISITIPEASSARYMKLGPDGHLRVLQWVERFAPWQEVADITDHLGECSYPMVCGKYGICSNGQCTCPSGTSFRPIKDRQPRLGCSQVIPLTCNASDNHSFLDLDNVTDFRINFTTANISNTDLNTCKEACLRNCSCRAAVFRFRSDSSIGACYLPSQIFSLMNNEWDFTDYSSSISLYPKCVNTFLVS